MADHDSVALAVEFLLRQPSTDHATACSILATLPVSISFPDNNSQSLRLAVLLQALRHELARPSLSDRILALIHSLLSLSLPLPVHLLPAAAAAAFLAVGVEAAVKHLRTRPPDVGEFKLAVRRVWKMRARRVLVADKELASCLLSDEFAAAKRELVAAMGNHVLRRGLVERDTKGAAVRAAGRFLEAAEIELGPPALVYVSRAMADGFLQQSNHSYTRSLSPPDKVAGIPACDESITIEPDLNLASDKADECMARENHFSHDALKDAKSFSQYDPVPRDEVKKILNELRFSAKDLKSVVEDPLPSVLHFLDNMVKQHVAGQSSRTCLEGNNNLSNERRQIPSLGDDVLAVEKSPTTANENPNRSNSGLTLKFDKLKQTAQTYQWSDDSFSSNSPGRKICLPSVRKRVVSPLKVEAGYKRRRMVKRWSSLEEDTLKTAIHEYGKGNWKVILNKYREIFEDRTEIDLKDKWRNMAKLL